jgi:hypothetical protein
MGLVNACPSASPLDRDHTIPPGNTAAPCAPHKPGAPSVVFPHHLPRSSAVSAAAPAPLLASAEIKGQFSPVYPARSRVHEKDPHEPPGDADASSETDISSVITAHGTVDSNQAELRIIL